MQCPNCKYEPTLSELQSASGCPKCGSKPTGAEVIRPVRPVRWSLWGIATAAFAIAVGLGVWWPHHVAEQKRETLAVEAGAQIRKYNGLVKELLDPSARLSRGQYLEKAQRRIADIDGVIAQSLAVDDSVNPGIAAQLAEYGGASRKLIEAFSEDVRRLLALELATSAHQKYRSFENNPDFQFLLQLPSAQIEQRQNASLATLKEEPDLIKRLTLLKSATEEANVYNLMAEYQKSKIAMNKALEAKDDSVRLINVAGEELFAAGQRLNELTGQKYPVEKWAVR